MKGVIANGGHQAKERAALAKAALRLLNIKESEIPVGVGTKGTHYSPQPHEYELTGWKEAMVSHTRKSYMGELFSHLIRYCMTLGGTHRGWASSFYPAVGKRPKELHHDSDDQCADGLAQSDRY